MRYFKKRTGKTFHSFLIFTNDNITKYKYCFPNNPHWEMQLKKLSEEDINALNKLYVEIPEEEFFIMMI